MVFMVLEFSCWDAKSTFRRLAVENDMAALLSGRKGRTGIKKLVCE